MIFHKASIQIDKSCCKIFAFSSRIQIIKFNKVGTPHSCPLFNISMIPLYNNAHILSLETYVQRHSDLYLPFKRPMYKLEVKLKIKDEVVPGF